jgi:prepilin-type N-terminal cleavage/methylation domain-containing protein
MKTKNYRSRQGFTLVELLVVIVIIAALAGLSAPVILRQRKAADRTEAINNIKQVGMALQEFDGDYSSFPDNNTAKDVKENTGTELNFSGTFSNDYFRQLIATGLKSEKPFYCKTSYTKKPDDNMQVGKCLDKGEVGFGYVMASQSEGQNSGGTPSRPVLLAPLFQASTDWTFDLEAFDNKAVVYRLDSSATALPIRTDSKKVSVNGKNIEATGENTSWGTDMKPVLRAPEKRGGGEQ